ncbi:hypothetical protein MS3_00010155 [Schistosoma haematobium]|uniref:15 kDa selenoprotein n=1 Tax=Schistosoma haematobium TaxID=6185 RepID=A0A922LXC4_SCHHA|nr:hypothetical protein MS3_00010155 [Schistosoma haematobium]KAH9595440.1 hypothetical protein MS3_00010155 [Schistosoma haematobium]
MLLADVLVCFLSLFIGVPANDTKSCAVSGFTSLLKCSSCSELKKFKLEKLETSCFQCCEDENVSGTSKVYRFPSLFPQKYAFAELVTCS